MFSNNHSINTTEKLQDALIPLYIAASEKTDPSRELSKVEAFVSRKPVYFSPDERQANWGTRYEVIFGLDSTMNQVNTSFIDHLSKAKSARWKMNSQMFTGSQAIEFTVKFIFTYRDTNETVQPYEETSFSIKV